MFNGKYKEKYFVIIMHRIGRMCYYWQLKGDHFLIGNSFLIMSR